jgi:hypothetical protein
MKRIFAVIELAEHSTFDRNSDEDLNALAEDLLQVTHGVASVVNYQSLADLWADESER